MLIIFFFFFFEILTSVPPVIIVRQEKVHASFGQTVALECISESQPEAFYYWLDPSGKKIIHGAFLNLISFNMFNMRMHQKLFE